MTTKRIILVATVLIVMLVVLQSCYDAATVVIDNGPTITKPVSFKNDILPIFNKSCSIAGCHNAGGHSPDLTAGAAYNSIINGKYADTGSPDKSVLYLYLTGKKSPQMPLGASANPSSINQLFLAWVKQGAKNN
jgi:hypothetical protein